ncbi:MAG: SDR family oxidoreductase [Clostridia bacterium]|nr:SDR family oxidoreductase [Clostridia bacterium]
MSVLFVTGAVRNSGLAIAEKFAREGFDIALSSRNGEEAKKTAKRITETYGVRARGYALDLTDPKDIERVFSSIKADLGRLDTFVANSANLGLDMGILNSTPEDFEAVMSVNLRGTFFCCQQAARIMKEQGGGAIVLISSVHSKACIPGRCLYSMSKGALNTLATSIAIEMGAYHVRANSLLAGAIRTDRWDGLTDDQVAARRRNWPVGIESTGEDIANAAFYLGSDLSRTVSGTELAVDSGILASLLGFNGGKN